MATRLLTADQAAEVLGTRPRFVRRLIQERRIQHYKVGRHVRIAETDLEDYIKQGRRQAVSA